MNQKKKLPVNSDNVSHNFNYQHLKKNRSCVMIWVAACDMQPRLQNLIKSTGNPVHAPCHSQIKL